MRALLIDNDDSFTWNLWQLIESLGVRCTVRRNDEISLQEVKAMRPDRIVLSPGPGGPRDARVSLDILKAIAFPILGVCLGHQCIAHVFGGENSVERAPKVMHGKTSDIFHEGKSILRGVPSPFEGARYHSLVVTSVPEGFEMLCWTNSLGHSEHELAATEIKMKKKKFIMGLRHKSLPLFGLQFHPESFLTEHGTTMMKNFLSGHWS